MTKNHNKLIETLLSETRIKPYQLKDGNGWLDGYKNELNQAKELYVYLHFLEIFLRNKIDIEFSKLFGDWLVAGNGDLNLDYKEQERINEVIILLKKTKKEINQDNIVSNLNFGFWTNLFHKSYNYPIWQQHNVVAKVFPHLKSYERNINIIHKQMEAVRKLRNRVFHFENLQSWNLEEMKRLIGKFIYAISGQNLNEILK
jgi:hypothetical protein